MDNIKFGNFIIKLRKEKNMTQKELAEKLNLTDKAISKWERGLSFPDITLWERLADVLGISLVELLKAEKIESERSTEIEELVTETVKISKDEVRKNKKKNRIAVIIMAIILILIITTSIIFNIFPRYNENLKYSQEYVIGQGNIVGEVNVENFASRNKDFEIGANKYGYAVFKNPDQAFRTLKQEYRKGIDLIQKEFHLLPLTKLTYKLYQTYGWQVTNGLEIEKEQARFITRFLDIYENSFE